MKLAVLVAISFFTNLAFASEVRITSFQYLERQTADGRSPAAEVCGRVEKPTGKPTMIKVTADHTSRNPGKYYAWTGKEGKFCIIIASFWGSASAELESD